MDVLNKLAFLLFDFFIVAARAIGGFLSTIGGFLSSMSGNDIAIGGSLSPISAFVSTISASPKIGQQVDVLNKLAFLLFDFFIMAARAMSGFLSTIGGFLSSMSGNDIAIGGSLSPISAFVSSISGSPKIGQPVDVLNKLFPQIFIAILCNL